MSVAMAMAKNVTCLLSALRSISLSGRMATKEKVNASYPIVEKVHPKAVLETLKTPESISTSSMH